MIIHSNCSEQACGRAEGGFISFCTWGPFVSDLSKSPTTCYRVTELALSLMKLQVTILRFVFFLR